MAREHKYRYWNNRTKAFVYMTLNEAFDHTARNEEFRDHRVDEGDWQQYTGLEDRNGKEIYEGDIVRSYHQKGEVIYASGSFGFWDEMEYRKLSDIMEVGDGHKMEVTGNIYEDPDLLKSK